MSVPPLLVVTGRPIGVWLHDTGTLSSPCLGLVCYELMKRVEEKKRGVLIGFLWCHDLSYSHWLMSKIVPFGRATSLNRLRFFSHTCSCPERYFAYGFWTRQYDSFGTVSADEKRG